MGCGASTTRYSPSVIEPPAPDPAPPAPLLETPQAPRRPGCAESATPVDYKKELETVRQQFAKVAPEVLAAFLSGPALGDDALKEFIRLNCPRFKDFTGEGECEIMMSDVHRKYVAMVEELVKAKTKDWPIENFSAFFAEASGEGMEPLLEEAARVNDFVPFGQMMRKKYEDILSKTIPPRPPAHVRVLWDFENVNPDRSSVPVQDAAERLEKFLGKRLGLCQGAKVDYKTTAFMPLSAAANPMVMKGLDRATVMITLCSSEVDDVAHKLVWSIDNEIEVLDPTHTTFVLVSSDTDFKTQLQKLHAKGYRTVTVHDYITRCFARQAMELHADHAFVWSEIIGSQVPAPSPAPALNPAPAPRPAPALNPDGGPPIYDSFAFGDDLVGMVRNWLGGKGYGFIQVRIVPHPGFLDFYCHVTALRVASRSPQYLVAGELVIFTATQAQPGRNTHEAMNVESYESGF